MQNSTKARTGSKKAADKFALRVYLSDNKQVRNRQLAVIQEAAEKDNRPVTGFLFEAARERVKALIGKEL